MLITRVEFCVCMSRTIIYLGTPTRKGLVDSIKRRMYLTVRRALVMVVPHDRRHGIFSRQLALFYLFRRASLIRPLTDTLESM